MRLISGQRIEDIPVHAPVAGRRCDSIQFNLDDFRDLQHMRPHELHDYMFAHLMTKLGPPQHNRGVGDCHFCNGTREIPCPNCGVQ